jgi:hypothetical protein
LLALGKLHNCAGNLIHQPQASVSTTACKRVASQRGSLTPAATAVSGLSNPAAQDPVPCLPENLKPISSSLANELRRQQHLKKRLKKQLTTLQRQLHNMSNIASSQTIGVLAGEGVVGTRDHSSGSYSTDSASSSLDDCFGNGFREECEDPLFSTATPPSVEQLQRQLVYVRSQLLQSSSESLADVLTGKCLLHNNFPTAVQPMHAEKTVMMSHGFHVMLASFSTQQQDVLPWHAGLNH